MRYALLAVLLGLGVVRAAEKPYIDPAHLDCPWPKHAYYKLPWRAYLETKPATDFLNGIGVAYHSPGNDELAVRLLAETGFRAIRIEVGWGSVKYDESGFSNEEKLRKLMSLVKQYGLRPTMLLNAHEGVPCPLMFFQKKLAEDAPKGSRTIKLADTKGLVVGRSGLNGLTGYWAAEALITSIDAKTGVCELSKALPKDLKAGNIAVATLRYLPLYPADAKEFDESAAGWTKYALMVCDLVQQAGIDDFDVEVWNELTFGTKFLRIQNYHDRDILGRKVPDFLNKGGNCWELARRTVEAVKTKHPRTRCIWGFSNTTFFHCKVENLPPGMDGQSYHPYGTGTRNLPEREQHKDRPQNNIDGYIPPLDLRMSEGWAHTFIQTECLIRHLNPEARKLAPAGTQRFRHYITEHGVVPAECGVTDEKGEWDIKTKCALRSFCLWLNKGLDVMHYFQAYDRTPGGMGLLPVNIKAMANDARFDDVATPPMRAIRNLTRAFAGAAPINKPAQLAVDITPAGPIGQVFPGDAKNGPLTNLDVFAFLPFQVTDRKFIAAVYVMTYDVTRPLPDERYRLTIRNLPAGTASVSLYDPAADRAVQVKVIRQADGVIEVEVPVIDTPRLLAISL